MATILWGKPKIVATAVGTGGSAKLKIPVPVLNSTTLNSARGDKHEAQIEGGGNEAIRYDRGTFTLEFEVRFAKERYMSFSDKSNDGLITGLYKLVVSDPADNTAPTMTMHEATGSYEDIIDPDGGARRHFYFESQIPVNQDGGSVPTEQITWGNLGSAEPASY